MACSSEDALHPAPDASPDSGGNTDAGGDAGAGGETSVADTGSDQSAGNQPPTLSAGSDQAVELPTSAVTLIGAASDPDGDSLSYAWTKTSGGAVNIVSPDAATTQVTGLVAGSYTFALTVSDGKGGTASDSVSVTASTCKVLVIEGTTVNDTVTGTSNGYNVPRSECTALIFRNNAMTSVNTSGYILQAGDEGPGPNNGHLDGEIISGNKFTWNGSDMTSITHGVFTGYNINAVVKHNYLEGVPMGIIRKSNGMTNTSGAVAYNIIRSPNVGIVVKGMNAVAIYNNTFYSARTTAQTYRGLIDVYTNTDIVPNGPATGTRIFNNVFYTRHQVVNINVGADNLVGFESDYNLFYCEDGSPVFRLGGASKTFAEWQAAGFDAHSVVVNPNFIDFTDLVPVARLDYGTALDAEWQTGLSVGATWGTTDPATVNQNGKWQVGARLYAD